MVFGDDERAPAGAPDGEHFDRYLRARQEGLISRKAVRDVYAVLGPGQRRDAGSPVRSRR